LKSKKRATILIPPTSKYHVIPPITSNAPLAKGVTRYITKEEADRLNMIDITATKKIEMYHCLNLSKIVIKEIVLYPSDHIIKTKKTVNIKALITKMQITCIKKNPTILHIKKIKAKMIK